jgi:hypothetical protein
VVPHHRARAMEIHFSNPAAMTSGSDPAQQGRTSALVPECLEEEGSLADPATSEDLFEKLAGAVSDKLISKGTRNDRFSTNPARDWFESVVARQLPKRSDGQPSFEAALDGPTLHDILERGLQLQLDQHQTQLLSKDVGTGSELIEWWDAQSGVDMSSMDPFQIALAALEEGKMISPTSKFRGNWDLAQAIFLMYIAISLPYRLGFKDGVILWSFWFWFDLAIDVYFLLDLFVNFRTAVITKEGVRNPSRAASRCHTARVASRCHTTARAILRRHCFTSSVTSRGTTSKLGSRSVSRADS